jgi:S-formylglutathione hydrolase FrmB
MLPTQLLKLLTFMLVAAHSLTAVRAEVGSPIEKIAVEQTGTQIRVLKPEKLAPDKTYRTIYVLPVEAGTESRFGDGLKEVLEQDLHNKHEVIFVAPTFEHLPWYADHPTNPDIRQEDMFLNNVIPLVEAKYPVSQKPEDRLLLGFSKSGWGAWSLLLRNGDQFGKAAAWDAPLAMTEIGKYGNKPIFGTQENFSNYEIAKLLTANVDKLKESKRLILTGYGGFRDDHVEIHALLEKLALPHVYRDGPKRKHDWHSGWVAESVELLLKE